MFSYFSNLYALAKELATSDDCFCCPHDCDLGDEPIQKEAHQDREGVIFWGKTPLVTVKKEKAPKSKRIPLTRDGARQIVWASRWDPKMRKSLQKVAAVTFWKAIGF